MKNVIKVLFILILISCEMKYYSDDFIPEKKYAGEYEISIVDVSIDNYDSLEYLLNFLLEERVHLIIINDSSIAYNITEEITNHLVMIPRSFSERPIDDSINKDFYKFIKVECEENVIGFFQKEIGFDSGFPLYHPAAEGLFRMHGVNFDDFLALDELIKIDYYVGETDIIVASPNDVYRYNFKDVVIITNLENEVPVRTPHDCYYNNAFLNDGNHAMMKSSHILVNSIYTLISDLMSTPEKHQEIKYSIEQAADDIYPLPRLVFYETRRLKKNNYF